MPLLPASEEVASSGKHTAPDKYLTVSLAKLKASMTRMQEASKGMPTTKPFDKPPPRHKYLVLLEVSLLARMSANRTPLPNERLTGVTYAVTPLVEMVAFPVNVLLSPDSTTTGSCINAVGLLVANGSSLSLFCVGFRLGFRVGKNVGFGVGKNVELGVTVPLIVG